MPIKNRHELGVMLACGLHEATNQPVAVVAKALGTAPDYMAYATGSLLAADTHTPVVNLFQGGTAKKIKTGVKDMYCSYVPTTACLGIMRMSESRAVYFIDGGQLKRIVIGSAGPVPTIGAAVPIVLTERADLMQHPLTSSAPDAAWYVGTAAAVNLAAHNWIEGIVAPRLGPDAEAAAHSIHHIVALQGVDHVEQFALDKAPTTPQAIRADFRDALFMSIVRVFASLTWKGVESVGRIDTDLRVATGVQILAPGKNIAALLVADETRIIGWGINTNNDNYTRHAETNAIQAYQRGTATALPDTVRLYTTLQPCFMCAGLYRHAGGTACVYDQEDPGMVGSALADTEVAYLGAFNTAGSFGAALNVSNRNMPAALVGKKTKGPPPQMGAPQYLQTRDASQLYSHAVQRFVALGMQAVDRNNSSGKSAWRSSNPGRSDRSCSDPTCS